MHTTDRRPRPDKRALGCLSGSIALCCLLCASSPAQHAYSLSGDIWGAHDPSIAKEGHTWYAFATGKAPGGGQIPIRCSDDLEHWHVCGHVFNEIPRWIHEDSPQTKDLWAPDITFYKGEYRLYYAYSLFGKNTSGIALATNNTLNANSPNYKWLDKGLVLRSTATDDYNAIDPNFVVDAKGRSWLAFGSFWSGIKLRRLDADGKLSREDTKIYSLATREKPADAPPVRAGLPARWQAIEAPFIIRHGGYYYLFVSWDLCCRGAKSTYRIIVGRAKKITGTYLDTIGKPMEEGGGFEILHNNQEWAGPGGESVLLESPDDLLVFHTYDAVTGRPALQISTIKWLDGWPQVALANHQSTQSTTPQIVSELRAGQYETAKAMLEKALQQSPRDASLWTLNGFALQHLGNVREALASYDRAIELSPDYLPALEGAAEMEYKNSDQRAVPLLKKILTLHPDDETSHAMLASIAFNNHDCGMAANEFARARPAIDANRNALEEYGSCLMALRSIADAIPVFQRLAELQPASDAARYNLAVVQSLADRHTDVIATLGPTIAEEHPDPDALDLAAESYEAKSDTPKAVTLLRQAIVASPASAKYYLDFANICLAHSAFQVGIDMLNAGLTRVAQRAPLLLARGILYIQLGQYDKSEADFAEAERLDPNARFGSAAQGLAELQRNDLLQAEATTRQRLLKKPNDAFLHYVLAETLARKGAAPGSAQFAEAVQSAQRAVELQPNFSLARDVLGRLYLEQGKPTEAIEQSRLAFEQDPTDQTALYHLIVALRKGHRNDEVPALAKKLAELREQARAKEAAEHKYALVEVKPPPSGAK